MTYPPLHDSPEAVHLRQTARAWLEAIDKDGLDHPAGCVHELAASKAHHAFLQAAIAYAEAVRGPAALFQIPEAMMPSPPLHRIGDEERILARNPAVGVAIDLLRAIPFTPPASTMKWRCIICGRSNFMRKCGHTCIGGYRRHNLKWEAVYG